MEQVVYGDILFVVNFSMDFLALYITGKILRYKSAILPLVFAAGIGAVYAVASLFLPGARIPNAIINLSFAMLMCYIVFGFSSLIILIRNTVILYGISFLMGGCMTAVFSIVNKGLTGRGIVINGEATAIYSQVSPTTLIIIAAISVIFSYICSAVMKFKNDIKTVEVAIALDGKSTSIIGLVDSGNLLCEPAGGLPVILCKYEPIEYLLPKGTSTLFREAKVSIMEYLKPDIARKLRIIPVSGAAGQTLVVGFIPDCVKIDGEKKNVCIAVDCHNNDFGGNEGAVPVSVL